MKAEPPDPKEFAGLVRAAKARLTDARNSALALESRFDLAYNAAHGLSLAGDRRLLAVNPFLDQPASCFADPSNSSGTSNGSPSSIRFEIIVIGNTSRLVSL